jgi:hypothetical protein
MKVLDTSMKATQMPHLGSKGGTTMKAEFPTTSFAVKASQILPKK